MKLIAATITASILIAQTLALSRGSQEDHCANSTVPLLRAYNPTIADHFYTTNPSEMEYDILNYGYNSEGDAAQVYPTQVPNTVPLYRLFSNSLVANFYTINGAERSTLLSQGWSDVGITAFVYAAQVCDTVPFFRIYNPKATDHLYTTSVSERDIAISQDGYVDEGIAAYVFPQP